MKTSSRYILCAVLPALFFVGACRSERAPEAGVPNGTEVHEAEPPASVTLSAKAVAAADLKTAAAATRLVGG